MLWQPLPSPAQARDHSLNHGQPGRGAPWLRRAGPTRDVSTVYLRGDGPELLWRFPDGAEWYAASGLDARAEWSPVRVVGTRAA